MGWGSTQKFVCTSYLGLAVLFRVESPLPVSSVRVANCFGPNWVVAAVLLANWLAGRLAGLVVGGIVVVVP